jgi:hypothetical protein
VSGLNEAGNVTKVEFFNGQTSLAALTEVPFEFTWEGVPQGIHSLTAKVFADGNSVVFSDPISIAVLESLPDYLTILWEFIFWQVPVKQYPFNSPII